MTNRLSAANLVARSAAFARAQRNPRLSPFRQRRGGAMRAVRPAPLTLLAALALLAILGALFLPDRAQAQAQVLVNNFGQTQTGQVILRNGDRLGQTFSIATTGEASYYTLSSIEILFSTNGIASTDMDLLTVSLWSTHASGTNAGHPKDQLYTLTNPGSVAADAAATFAAPADLTLAAGRTYAVVVVYSKNIDAADIADAPFWEYAGTGDDADPAPGWSIVDSSHQRSAGEASWEETANRAQKIRVNGTAVQPDVLVSNLGQTKTGQLILRNGDRSGQTFSIATTGEASYYTLSSIEILFSTNGIASTDMGLLTVSLWSIHASGTNAGQPDSLLYTLTNPASVTADAAATFAAPADLTLAAGRTYAVVVVYSKNIDAADIADAPFWEYAGTGDDADPAPGWSIVDSSHQRPAGEASWEETANRAQKISVNGNETINNDPVFASTAETREVAENSAAGTNVGAVIPEATDADDDTLTYSMEGDDEASFDFDASTRQITTKTGVTYNYEATENTYSVTVTADDGNDGTATVAVTINLTDVAEKSAKPAKPRLAAVTGTPTSLNATWTKPGLNGGPEITGYNVQYKLSTASTWSDFAHSGTGVMATITGLTAGMSYQVRVQAKNGETDSDWSDASDAQNTTPTPTPDATITSLLSRLDVEVVSDASTQNAGYDASDSQGSLSPAGFNYPAGFGPWYTVEALAVKQGTTSNPTAVVISVRGTVTSVTGSGDHRAHVLPSDSDITLHLEGENFTRSYSLESAETRTVTKCTPEDGTERHCREGETATETYNWKSSLPPRLTDGDSILVRLRYRAPRPGTPGTPTVTVPTGKSGALIVNWAAPSSNNPAVLGYHVHVTRGSQLRPKSVDASTTRLPVLLLEPDTAYDVRVRARTALATGPWSGTARARTNPLQGTNGPQVTLDLNGVTKVKERDGLPMRLKVTGMPNLHAGAFPERFEGEKQLRGVEFLLLDRIAKVYTYEDHPGGCGGGSFRSGALTIGDDGEVYHDSGYLVIPAGMSAFGPLYVELDTRCGNTRSSGNVGIDTTERHCVEIADSSNTVPAGRTCPSGGMPGHAVDRLTARFVGVPRSHDGESEFTLRVAFIEDVGISPSSLREDALTVTGGTVTQAQRVDDRSDLFEITVEPASDEDVTITLPAGSDCAAAGAICTGGEDPKKLYNSPTATVSGPTLTASFQGLPSQHDGETAFSFRIAFSDDIATGEEEFRDHSVEVWGGRVTRAEPVDQRRDLWEVEIEPASDDLVMVSLRPSLSCDETGAVCTAGGRRLSVSPATMVAGPSTWPVQVNGEAQVGKTLTADPSNISDRFGVQVTSMTYQWLANNARMPGAGGSTYTPGEGKQGKKISVMATYTDDRGNEDTVASGPTDPVAARERNSRATGLPLISGRALVGQTLTADPSLIFDADGLENAVFHYFWEADDDSIPGATDPTYTPVQADVGKVITVIVSFLDDAGYGQSMTSPATLAVTTAEAAAAVKFAISLRYAANADGSVSLYWNAPDDEATGYRIDRRRYSMGEPKGLVYVEDTGSAATAYTDIEVTAGAPHSYRVQAIRGAELGEKTKFFKTKVFPLRKAVNSPATGSSAISGVAQVGETLTADTSGIVDADGLEHVTHNYLWGISGSAVIGAVYGYQWLADGAEIEEATGSTYILADADEGKAIRVRVSFTDDGGHRETLTSSATAAVTQPNTPATGLPTVSGKARVGETLTVDTSGISDENGLEDATFTHRWITDDSVVVGAGTRAYTPTGGDQGKAVKVRVSFSDDAGNWETRTSAETAAVEARANSPATGLPTISGTAQVGETLTADTSGIEDADGSENAAFTYQWIRNDGTADTDISGATGETYIPVSADEDKSIKVQVSFTDDAGNAETLTSAPTAAVEPWPENPYLSSLSVSGVDGTAIDLGTFDPTDTTYSATVASTVNRVTVDATVSLPEWTDVSFGPRDASSHNDGHQVNLQHGTNLIVIGVFSYTWDHEVLNTYSVEITREGTAPAGSANTVSIDSLYVHSETGVYAPLAREGSTFPFVLTRTGDTSESLTVAVDVYESDTPAGIASGSEETVTVEFEAGQASARLDVETTADSIATGSYYLYGRLVPASGYQVDDSGRSARWSVWEDDYGKLNLAEISVTDSSGAVVDIGTFDPTETSYVGSVGSTVEYVTVAVTEPFHTIRSTTLPEDSNPDIAGHQVNLSYGTNQIIVVVTRWEDGVNTYGLEINRAGSADLGSAVTVSVWGTDRYTWEGDPIPLLLTRTGDTSEALTAQVEVTESGGDMVSVDSKGELDVEFEAGHASARLDVSTNADDAWEEHSTVEVTVKESSSYQVSSDSGAASILVIDNDVPRVTATLTVDSTEVEEGDETTATITVVTDGPREPHAFMGNLLIRAEAGTAGEKDFQIQGVNGARMGVSSVGFDPVESGGVITSYQRQYSAKILMTDDDRPEADESFRVYLKIGKNGHDALTLDEDSDSHIITIPGGEETPASADSFGYATVMVADSGTSGSTFTVTWTDAETCSTYYRAQLTYARKTAVQDHGSIRNSSSGLGSTEDGGTQIAGSLDNTDGIGTGFVVSLYCTQMGLVSEVPIPTEVTWNGEKPKPGTYSSEPPLNGLTVSSGTLSPAFSKFGSLYAVLDLPNGQRQITLSPTVKPGYTVSWDPATDADLTVPGHQVDLYVGYNTISLAVDPDQGGMSFTYDIIVKRSETGVEANSPATGTPTISGTAQAGEALTADTAGIADADGLTNVSYNYQWLADDTEIAGATGNTYVLTSAELGKTIKVRVTFADDAGNEETLTSEATAAVSAALPPPPDNVRAVTQKSSAVKLTWDAPDDATVTGYRIDRRSAANPSDQQRSAWSPRDNHTLVEDTGSADTSYTDQSAEEGMEYEYRISARNESGAGEGSDWVRAVPEEEPVWGDGPPGAPGNLTITAGDQEITLSWDPPADNGAAPATRYRIEWRMDGKDYKKGHWGTAGSTTYTKTDLANGVKYVFRVKAENGSGNSYGPYGPASEEVSATPTSGSAVDLGTPVLSNTKTLHHGMVQLDWEDIEDAGWYVVQYYHVKSGEWLDLPAAGVDIAFHGSGAVVSDLHGLSWLRVRAVSCAGESEWSQIEELYGTRASDWEDVPVPEVAEGDQIDPCPVILGTPVLSGPETLHHGMVRLDWEDIEDAGWYVVQYYHVKSGEWLDLPAAGVDIAFHGSSAVASDLHGLSWLRVRAVSCAGESEWSQIEELYGTNASDWEGVPVPEVAEGDEIEPCDEDVDTPDNSPATGAPAIGGTVQVNETLTANTSGVADADGLSNVQYEYQWLADDSDISGATNTTYTPVAADEGKAVKVRVSFADDAGNNETLTSEATDAVAAAPTPNSPATGAPAITGTAQVGETLTADTSGIADADGLGNVQYEHQWLADDSEIAGATGSTYTLVDADEGERIKVEVTFTDDAGNEEELTSAATGAVVAAPNPNSPATGAPTISGAAQVGETLTADTSGLADADGLTNATFSYQWLADDTEIAGATSLTYTLVDADEGKAIKVEVTFTDDASNNESLTSAATAAVAAAGPSEPPAKPRGLEATATHDQVVLTWDDPGDDSITGYVILRRVRVNDQGGDFSVLVSNTETAATTYTDNEVAASTTYTYRIKAINEHGTSERSRWVHIDTPAPPVPDKPRGLEATASNGQVVLTWEDPQDDSITGYVILRRLPGVDQEGQFDELVANTGTAAITYTDTSVEAETRYTYRIKAINEHGASERSRWVHIDTPAAP